MTSDVVGESADPREVVDGAGVGSLCQGVPLEPRLAHCGRLCDGRGVPSGCTRRSATGSLASSPCGGLGLHRDQRRGGSPTSRGRAEVIGFDCRACLRAPRVLVHNPAGGRMMIVLLAMIGVVSATGIVPGPPTPGGARIDWVDNFETYIQTQSESALRHLASLYAYDDGEENESTLRGNVEEVSKALRDRVAGAAGEGRGEGG